jgi:hypothetical protein
MERALLQLSAFLASHSSAEGPLLSNEQGVEVPMQDRDSGFTSESDTTKDQQCYKSWLNNHKENAFKQKWFTLPGESLR